MAEGRDSGANVASFPTGPIHRVTKPISRFLHIQSASGVVLLFVTLAALALANSPLADTFLAFWKTPVGFAIGGFEVRHSLGHWINDALMAIFFFVIGLEVKREIVFGELRDFRSAALPIAAAIGGMIVPAAIYLALQWDQPGRRGWGIPMATDIAFVVGCLAILGRRVPGGLRILLLSLAIIDDIGAILVIAIGYTESLNLVALGWGTAGIAVVMLAARLGVRSIPVYVLLGAGVWFGFHESGVHATIAGVILGLLTPARPWVSEEWFRDFAHRIGDVLQPGQPLEAYDRHEVLQITARAATEAVSPLERLERMLHPWVGFVIMPLFAFANAGVPIRAEAFGDPVAVAVAAGLIAGKVTGIFSFSWLAVAAGLARLPRGVNWPVLFGGGVLGGIGFTMSLFIAGLALEGAALDAAKIGVLSASGFCAVAGMALLVWLLPRHSSPGADVPDRLAAE